MTDSPQPEPAAVKPSASPLAAALAAVQADLPKLGKSETGKVSGVTPEGNRYSYEYRYADLAAISAEILPLLGRHGLAFTSWPTTTPGGLVLRYHLIHEAGEIMTGDYPIGGKTAQALGSAITYARRYCLCAVTGIAPDKDDDAAVVDGEREQEREAARIHKIAEDSAAYVNARNAVVAAWEAHVGAFDVVSAGKAFAAWSKGGVLADAGADQLAGFRRWIMDQPLKDAGAPPESEGDGSAEDVAATGSDATYRATTGASSKAMTPRTRGKLFALMQDIGLNDKADQLEWINATLQAGYESRSQVTAEDAGKLIKTLEGGIAAPGSSEAAT